jgi:3,4-dihydroxy 2-butanone 4-phosphate synthase/GTP cyclohydrolase II
LEPAAVIVEIINDDGTMARRDDLEIFAKEHGIKIGTIADLINYRIANEQTVEEIESHPFETEYGTFTLHRFREFGADETHLALVKGDVSDGVSTVRVHGFHPLRDLFAAKNDTTGRSGWSVRSALEEIQESERGVLVWIGNHQPIDLGEALDKAAENQSISTIAQQPYRSIGVGAQILRHLGVRDMRLLSSPMKFYALSGFELNVVDFVQAPKQK